MSKPCQNYEFRNDSKICLRKNIWTKTTFVNTISARCSARANFLVSLIAHIIAMAIIRVGVIIVNVIIIAMLTIAKTIVIGISTVIVIVVGIVIVIATVVVVAVVRVVSAIARPAGWFCSARSGPACQRAR